MNGRGHKLGSYVHLLMSFNNLILGIFEKKRFVWSKMCQKWPKLAKRVYISAHKNKIKYFFKNP